MFVNLFLQETSGDLVSPPISPIPLASDNGEVNPQYMQVCEGFRERRGGGEGGEEGYKGKWELWDEVRDFPDPARV